MERQGIFLTAGSVALMGAITLALTRPVGAPWLLIVVIPLALLGVYAIVASSTRLPLPGDKARSDQKKRTDAALNGLWQFHATCIFARDSEVITDDMFERWLSQLTSYLESAWGSHERSGVLGGNWKGGNFYKFAEIEGRLYRLIERAHSMTVLPTFDPNALENPDWILVEGRAIPDPETESIFREFPPSTEV